MKLFTRLLRLHQGNVPLEDFFTEIVAYLFEVEPQIFEAWLQQSGILPANYSLTYISTQEKYEPLAHHTIGSRPDIQITLSNGSDQCLIFIESKIGAQEGVDQLLRYADILAQQTHLQHKVLLYITRDFDPKNSELLLRNSKGSVQFKQFRWYTFYQFLLNRGPHILVQEITTFMEEHGMAFTNQFSSVDILTLANFPKAFRLMEETLWGRVHEKFCAVIGRTMQRSVSMNDLRRYERYFLIGWLEKDWWCGLGYYLNTVNATDYPKIGIQLEVPPFSKHRTEILQAMQEICQQLGWQGFNLHDPRVWARIEHSCSLRDFLGEVDHVSAVEEHFLKLLDEVDAIKVKYPHLPWAATEQGPPELEGSQG